MNWCLFSEVNTPVGHGSGRAGTFDRTAEFPGIINARKQNDKLADGSSTDRNTRYNEVLLIVRKKLNLKMKFRVHTFCAADYVWLNNYYKITTIFPSAPSTHHYYQNSNSCKTKCLCIHIQSRTIKIKVMKLINDYSHYNIILWNKNGTMWHYHMLYLSFEFLDEDFDYILFLKFDFPQDISNPNIRQLQNSLESFLSGEQDLFIILTTRREAPLNIERIDEFIYSFSCNYIHFKKMIIHYRKFDFQPKNLLFKVLDYIFLGHSNFKKVIAKQIPFGCDPKISSNKCDVIIPHKGDNAYLNNLLFFLNQLDQLQVYVGIDQEIDEEIAEFKNDYSATEFYSFNPHPVGPYVIRNRLIEESKGNLLFFQDSDDIPCADRFARISDYMINNSCQLCGSHEIKLDYYSKTVRAIRYPINVKSSLQQGPGHSLLHPSSAITRDAFYSCEKLSEERIFGNDTKFLYHSYFILDNIQNIDEFLYIRRLHPNSLTTSPATSLSSPIRLSLLSRFIADFALIKLGKLKLENSSLRYIGPRFKYEVKRI